MRFQKGSMRVLKETLEPELEEEIEELRTTPEFESIDSFMAAKIDDEDYDYNFIELQALARNVTASRTGRTDIKVASPIDLVAVKKELEEMGFLFIGREVSRSTRGFSSGYHGSHPFAGSVGGGTGMGTGYNGPVGWGIGGGPGSVGGSYKWDPNDKKNLGMGAKKSDKK